MINQPIFQIIIDTIPNPVLITDGKELIKCNKEFIDFFNYTDLKDFKKHNDCICDLFVEQDGYFSLASIDKIFYGQTTFITIIKSIKFLF